MRINNFIRDLKDDYYKEQEYKRVFNGMMKVKNNPISDFIDNKISFNELREGLK